MYAHKSNKIIEIDECLIAVEGINKSEIFNKEWEYKDNIKISYSSDNEINIGSSYNLFADSLKFNDININARTRFLDIIDLNFSSRFDPYITNESQTNNLNEFEKYEISAHGAGHARRLAGLPKWGN